MDANATVDFESHIINPSDPSNFNLKPQWKRKRDAEITKVMKQYDIICAENIESTDLEFHTQHVFKMFKLMKCHRDTLNNCVDESIIYDHYDDMEIKQEDMRSEEEEKKQQTVDISNVNWYGMVDQYNFRYYPKNASFDRLSSKICDDMECKLFINEIKSSSSWNTLIQSHHFTDTNKNILKTISAKQFYTDAYDTRLERVYVALLVNKQWHPGVIVMVDLEDRYVNIFLPNDNNFDRLIKINKKIKKK
eukprot:301937_1